ncbi:hypothetical protein HYH02_007659 [Chlamydomonas schloesseri]|uniref:Protein kinase domain-containing protein n=1 Tax=Chlamydomonas schloesseri TaxID=2026947 RepID=A0A835WHZ9_9CHLO|nr:hypothetical protein HYH02_007659 [Chlamydomonas schloesseri]|eukprot:KAG2447330.1 hypothetical protein HYH02_007659 [Chlamydomonas schloesseri]
MPRSLSEPTHTTITTEAGGPDPAAGAYVGQVPAPGAHQQRSAPQEGQSSARALLHAEHLLLVQQQRVAAASVPGADGRPGASHAAAAAGGARRSGGSRSQLVRSRSSSLGQQAEAALLSRMGPAAFGGEASAAAAVHFQSRSHRRPDIDSAVAAVAAAARSSLHREEPAEVSGGAAVPVGQRRAAIRAHVDDGAAAHTATASASLLRSSDSAAAAAGPHAAPTLRPPTLVPYYGGFRQLSGSSSSPSPLPGGQPGEAQQQTQQQVGTAGTGVAAGVALAGANTSAAAGTTVSGSNSVLFSATCRLPSGAAAHAVASGTGGAGGGGASAGLDHISLFPITRHMPHAAPLTAVPEATTIEDDGTLGTDGMGLARDAAIGLSVDRGLIHVGGVGHSTAAGFSMHGGLVSGGGAITTGGTAQAAGAHAAGVSGHSTTGTAWTASMDMIPAAAAAAAASEARRRQALQHYQPHPPQQQVPGQQQQQQQQPAEFSLQARGPAFGSAEQQPQPQPARPLSDPQSQAQRQQQQQQQAGIWGAAHAAQAAAAPSAPPPQAMSARWRAADADGAATQPGPLAAAATVSGASGINGNGGAGGGGGGGGGVQGVLQRLGSRKSSREQSSGRLPVVAGKPGRLPRHATQVAFLQMLQFGSTGAVPLHQLATCDINRLSRELFALQWVGQGGGGAVFQAAWQGATVAVKFLLAQHPAHVDATALEAMVSMAVRHPNVVHTYCAEVTRLTEASFAEPPGHPVDEDGTGRPWGCGADDTSHSASALYNALMMSSCAGTDHMLTGGPQRARSRLQHMSNAMDAGATAGSGGGTPQQPHQQQQQQQQPGAPVLPQRLSRGGGSAGQTFSLLSGGGAAADVPARRTQTQLEVVRAEAARPTGGGGAGTAAAAAAATHVDTPGTESLFFSEEGFGEPDPASHGMGWSVRQVLSYLKARPGMYLTHIIMEHCDRGSLLSAIKRGVFSMEGLPEDSGSFIAAAAAATAAAAMGSTGGGGLLASSSTALGAGMQTSRTSVTAAMAAAGLASGAGGGGGGEVASPTRLSRRVVLRALLRTARDVAQGMCHLHANGIIHGDLKPGNVLLRGCRTDRRGFVAMVADFGLSKLTHGDKPLELHHWSTVTVMAPEVIMGRWLKASDVWAFGVLLWSLLSGDTMPYGQANVQQILRGVAAGTLKPEWPANAHPALVRLGKACLSTNPDMRPSFDAIAKVLTKIEGNIRNELRVQRAAELQQLQQLQLHGESSASSTVGGRFTRGSRGLSGAVVHPLEKLRTSIA